MKLSGVVKIGLWALAGCLLLAGGVASSQSAGQGRELHETYDLAPNGAVAVSNTSGYIRVTSWNENRVKVDALKRGRREEELGLVEIQVVTRPDRIEIRTIYPRGVGVRSSSVSVDYDLKVPRGAALDGLTTSSGAITVSDPVARVTARSTSGAITVRQVAGDAILSSTSGRIAADRIGGGLSVTTTSGDLLIGEVASTLNARCTSCNIRAAGLRDDVTAYTTSGNIEVERIGGRVSARATSGWVKINDVGGDVNAESYSDSVTVTNVRGRVTAKALSGNVVVRNAGEGARVEAVSGNVELSDAKGRVEIGATSGSITLNRIDSRDVSAKGMSGGVNFTGRVYEGGRYEFVSFSGNVVLVLPPESSFNLTAQSHSGSINTEFPLQIRQGAQFGGRGPIIGTAGKGGAEVRAVSHSGGVHIRKDAGQKR
jgi:DUF4097 and DUF4098 domain-containing protein YvlB